MHVEKGNQLVFGGGAQSQPGQNGTGYIYKETCMLLISVTRSGVSSKGKLIEGNSPLLLKIIHLN